MQNETSFHSNSRNRRTDSHKRRLGQLVLDEIDARANYFRSLSYSSTVRSSESGVSHSSYRDYFAEDDYSDTGIEDEEYQDDYFMLVEEDLAVFSSTSCERRKTDRNENFNNNLSRSSTPDLFDVTDAVPVDDSSYENLLLDLPSYQHIPEDMSHYSEKPNTCNTMYSQVAIEDEPSSLSHYAMVGSKDEHSLLDHQNLHCMDSNIGVGNRFLAFVERTVRAIAITVVQYCISFKLLLESLSWLDVLSYLLQIVCSTLTYFVILGKHSALLTYVYIWTTPIIVQTGSNITRYVLYRL